MNRLTRLNEQFKLTRPETKKKKNLEF